MTESSPFSVIHSDGSEIRLLVLLPSEKDAPIHCRLETASLSSNPDYDVLSYAWSCPSKYEEITLDDTPFRVPEPLAAVLRRLRLRSKPRRVWIDAVCIIQQDHAEKEQQVLLLPRIYSQARRVYVWLGESTIGTRTAGAPVLEQSLGVPQGSPRLSIVQEALLAKYLIFICGPEKLTWESMGRALKASSKKLEEGEMQSFAEIFCLISRLRQRRSDGQGILSPFELLYKSRRLECENPRDRIYGFLGLAPSVLEAGVVPTYDTSVSTAQVYTDFARKMIQHSERLDILNCVREWRGSGVTVATTANEMDGLPSWAPNWAGRTANDPEPLLDWSDVSSRYCAGRLMEARIKQNEDPKTLVLNGIRFDEVAELGIPWHPEVDIPPPSRNGIEALEQWEALALAAPLSCPYGGDAGRKAALWRTYIADFAGDRSAPKHHSAFMECWYGRASWPYGFSSPADIELHDARPRNLFRVVKDALSLTRHGRTEYTTYARRAYAACAHRRLLVSKRGYIGLAPWNAQPGDVVAVLYGGSTPFLFRPGSTPGVYSLVGECFVYGIMAGEALAWEHAIAAAREFRIV
ncbi:heterokaryon incompatibility protein-domain-containing protein [Parachaetomium inaequale]|uniref:Heterokaryon incompatibility protein-domain-containing protein n=1 Tax=Parachaetomium inaequale TaxID=2588326 RepID=A0AAN6PIN8_9PEZI|nr:heterokaryon incompatibility protein-domain-containing protein [Parachaetomium inaequale]